nr:hypothetical protein [Tanacetum cinerariifolium]
MFIPANMISADSMNHVMAFLAKAFQRYYTTPINNNQRISSNPSIRAAGQSYGNPDNQNYGNQGSQNYVGDRIRIMRRDYQYLKEHMLLAKKGESGVPLTDDEYGLLAHAAAAEEDEEEDLLANYIFMAKLHKATSDSEDDAEPTYHTDSIAEVHNYDTIYDNDMFNISEPSDVNLNGAEAEQNISEHDQAQAFFGSLIQNLQLEVDKCNKITH